MFRLALNRLHFSDLASSAIILLCLALALQLSQLFSRVDNVIFDIGQKLIVTPAPDDVVIIAIDENSLSQLGRWPWSRKVHADLLNRLSEEKPAALGFDIIFAEPDKNDPVADRALASAIGTAGNVVLPVLIESTRTNGQVVETLPLPILSEQVADLGSVHAKLDEDSIARSIFLHEGIGSPVWQLFSQAIINVANNAPTKNNFKRSIVSNNQYQLIQKDQRKVNFLGPTGHFSTVSYVQALKGDFMPGIFKDKIVLVGATALGMNDLLTTPVSGLSLPMSGVEFHANVLESIRKDRLIKEAPFWLTTLIVLAIAVLPLIWMPKLSALFSLLSTLFFMIFIMLLAGVLPKFFNVWIPPSAALVPLLMAYPVWSWRKLEAAQKFLDFELDYLKNNLISLPEQQASSAIKNYDKFDARIQQVRTATEQLRYLQRDRKETLAFISHDLKAPIARALLALESNEAMSEKLYKPLSQSLYLAEDFLQASRAEMMDTTTFSELDFASLVHQAIDDAYDEASKKEINLKRDVVEGMIWMHANFGLLHRALLNLILNAIKYGPNNADVLISLQLNAQKSMVKFSVMDSGPGIPLDEQNRLFKRFSRVSANNKLAEGTGLGLYFVRTVVEKHHGTIQVDSDKGKPTTFSLHLPIVGFQSHEA